MATEIAEIRSLEELEIYVHQMLCHKENLVPELFATRVTKLVRAGKVCGLQFSLDGPRCVKLGAVWARDQNTLYFYDTRGNRYHKQPLPARLNLEPAAA
jgi:hypothetical protein